MKWQESAKAFERPSFLDLPTELRFTVYEYALRLPPSLAISVPNLLEVSARFLIVELDDRTSEEYTDGHTGDACSLWISPQLLRTCKQVHAEAAAYLYENTFYMTSPEANPAFHKSFLSFPTYAPLIQHIDFDYRVTAGFRRNSTTWRQCISIASTLSQTFPGLKSLTITVNSRKRAWSDWVELLFRREHESEEVHIARVRKWMRTLYILDRVRIPDCLRLRLNIQPQVIFLRNDTYFTSTELDIGVFQKAFEGFKKNHR